MKHLIFCLIPLLLLSACCNSKTRDCPAGIDYTDFFNHQAPDSLFFSGSDGSEVRLDLISHSTFGGDVAEYCSNHDNPPPCDRRFFYNYQGVISDETFYIYINGSDDGDEYIQFTFRKTDRIGGMYIIYNPIDLTPRTHSCIISFIDEIELNGNQYPNVFYGSYEAANEIDDIYVSSMAGFIQFTLMTDGVPIVYDRIE